MCFALKTVSCTNLSVLIPLRSPQEATKPTAIAVGSFDGLHQGHRRVISQISCNSDISGIPTVVSFWPHPREILYGDPRLRLDMPAEKLTLLASLGIQQLVLIPFNERLAMLTPEKFVREVIKQQLGAVKVAVGKNFRFGIDRSGNASDLGQISQELGIRVEILPMLWDGNEKVSSSRIRRALEAGEIKEATRLLGRPYRFSGNIVNSPNLKIDGNWRKINLLVDRRKFLPCQGVYAVWARFDQRGRDIKCLSPIRAIMSIERPLSLRIIDPSIVEIHLIDQCPILQGFELYIEPVILIRNQKKFSTFREASQQQYKDIEYARKLLRMPVS